MTWVHDRIFAAGGNHIPTTWGDFADQTGVTAVLHLAPDKAASFQGPPPEAFLWLNVGEEAQISEGERHLVGRFLVDCLRAGKRVLLHSSLGRHRTRWAYVAYCISTGQSVRAALRQAAEQPWLSPYHTDVAAWEAFAGTIRANFSDRSPNIKSGGTF